VSNVPDSLRYTSEHEYLKQTDDPAIVEIGITDYAQGELGDLVFVSLPGVGDTFDEGDAFGTIEAVKAVSELYCPIGAEVVAVNEDLDADPAAINRDAYGEGWMIRLKMNDPADLERLMDADAYKKHIGEE
jgi:glycine cleavage system H protein